MNTYKEATVLKKTLRDGRIIVRIEHEGKTFQLPNANFEWLKGNPAFNKIPKGYVVHHLDHNEMNDDITNLVIMQKYHHTTHHWKQKTIRTEVDFDGKSSEEKIIVFKPNKKPKIYYDKRGKRWRIHYFYNDPTKSRLAVIWSWNGMPFRTREMAVVAREEIWPDKPWEEKIFGTTFTPPPK